MLDGAYDDRFVSTRGIHSIHPGSGYAHKCEAPCSVACPAGIDIPKFQLHVGQGRYSEAFSTIFSENPFPSTCGRICFNACEGACHRSTQDEALAIRCLGRFVGDQALHPDFSFELEKLPLNGKRVAVLGAGPSGLSAAFFLTVFGFSCDVYETASSPDQSAQWAIPESRLPKAILRMEIDRIRGTGVHIHCGRQLDSDFVKTCLSEYDAVVVGSGISQLMTFAQCVARDETSLQGALQAGPSCQRIELGNVTVEMGAIPVVYGGGWYNGIQSIAHAVGAGKTAAIALYAFFDTGSSAIRESVEISRVGNGSAQSMEIYLLGRRSRAGRHVMAETDIDRSRFPLAARLGASGYEDGRSGKHPEEIEQTLGVSSAHAEALRCYGCGYDPHHIPH